MNKTSYILKNATIVDGSSNDSYVASLFIKNDKIEKIHNGNIDLLNNQNVHSVIDCKNKIITPGFIDVHGHSDLQILRSSNMRAKIQQGITTEIAGNCGIGPFPIDLNNKEVIKSMHDLTKDVLGSYDYNFNDFESFSKIVQKNLPNTNVLFLQSHTALRANAIFPNANRAATDDEINLMCSLLDKSLSQGCIGLSTGLYYAPCLYAEKKELIELLKVVKKHNKVFCTHHRCEGDDVINSLNEVIDLAKEVGVKLEISHLKAIGVENQKYVDQMLNIIEKAKDEGLNIGFDQYPYEYGSTSLYSLLPPSYLKLSYSELKVALNDKNERDKIKLLMKTAQGWDSIVKMCGFENIRTMYLETQRELENKNIKELSLLLKNRDDEDSCFDTLFDILLKEEGVALMIDVTQSLVNIEKILNHPLMCFGTDAIYSGDEKSTIPSHPRSYQAAVHLIDVFYKQRKAIKLENLIYNMTYKSAQRFDIEKRGLLKEGYYADIVVFDIDRIKDLSSLENIKIEPDGIDYVFVNGNLVYQDKKIINSHSGSIIKQF